MNSEEKELTQDEILAILKRQILDVTKGQEEVEEESENDAKSMAIVTIHPVNENFKLFSVFNDFTSEEELLKINDSLNTWFSSLHESIFLNVDRVYGEYLNKLIEIKEYLENQEILGSFSGAIVGDNKTIVSKVGNTAVYKYFNEGFDEMSVKGLLKIISNDTFNFIVLSSNNEYNNLSDNRIKIVSSNIDKDDITKVILENE